LKYYLIILIAFLIGCQSKPEKSSIKTVKPVENENKAYFDFYDLDKPFEMLVTEFYPTNHSCSSHVIPYALLIGKTLTPDLPDVVSVISSCDYRVFQVGKKLKIIPDIKPELTNEKNSLDLLYMVITDTIVQGKQLSEWVIGSENKAIMGRPELTQ
jgi:hypothetical protein